MENSQDNKGQRVNRVIPLISLILIPFLTIFFSHFLETGKDDFERFRYASEILSNDKSTTELKNWALSEVLSYMEKNNSPKADMDAEKAKLYALIVGPILNKNKGMYCYNISSALDQMKTENPNLANKRKDCIDTVKLDNINVKQSDALRKYIKDSIQQTNDQVDFVISSVKLSCEQVDQGIDDLAKRPPNPDKNHGR